MEASASLPVSESSSAREAMSERSTRRRRVRRARRPQEADRAPHEPLFPHLLSTTSIVLDPEPNTRIRSACVVGDTLVTVHRNGIRLYRARHPGSSLWTLKEVRDRYDLRDAYLAAVVQPSLREDAAVFSSPYSRYFCVATGNDRTTQSVCVLSTAGYFNLHHEMHGTNRIVALHFAQLALEPLQEDALTPFVLSVDETGEVVLFNVERNAAVRLRRREAGSAAPVTESEIARQASGAVNVAREEARVLDELTFYETVNKNTDSVSHLLFRRISRAAGTVESSDTYHLESGVATQAVLIGPCVELCGRCHNLFSLPTGCGGGGGPAPDGPGGRYVAMSILISSRARDIARGDEGEGTAKGDDSDAELAVTFLRVLWSSARAYVWHESRPVREVAPIGVCDTGVALCSRPYQVGRPMTALVGRPRLRMWRLSACTGQVLGTQGVYDEDEGKGRRVERQRQRRSDREFFRLWVPLGRHLVERTSWLCVAAVTDDDTILLLGRDPDGVATRGDGPTPAAVVVATEQQQEKRLLEAWLDEVEGAAAPTGEVRSYTRFQGDEADGPPAARDYIVLLELYSPPSQQRGLTGGASSSSSLSRRSGLAADRQGLPGACRDGVKSVLADHGCGSLLVLLGDDATVLRVPLPFATVQRPAEKRNDAAGGPVSSPSPRRDADGGLWESTRRALSGGTVGWLGLGAAAPAQEPEAGHRLNIVRPLAAAMFGWAGSAPERPASAVAPPVTLTEPEPEPPRRVEAVYISVEHSPRRRKEPIHCEEATADGQEHLQRRYMMEQVHLALGREAALPAEERTNRSPAALREEPSARSALQYEWRDAHDGLYIAFSLARDAIVEAQERHWRAEAAAGARERALYRRPVLAAITGPAATATTSTQFRLRFLEIARRRRRLRDHRGVFDFAACFTTGAAPQQLVDLQERDKCQFELADLGIRQAAALAAIDPAEEVRLYQNEERRPGEGAVHASWRPHPTFPYDDESGRVADVFAWNATTGPAAPGKYVWAELRRAPDDDDAVGSPVRLQALARELRGWTIGPWQYARRWPSADEARRHGFAWDGEERQGSLVRRRALSRQRVDVKAQAARKHLVAEHRRELDALREELGL